MWDKTFLDRTDRSVNIKFPDTIKIHEHRAPTDDSIKLMEECHDKALQNIIAKIKVENNLVNGECFCCHQPWNINEWRLVFKFKINNEEFTLEGLVERHQDWGTQSSFNKLDEWLKDKAKSVMLWFALRKLQEVFFKEITGVDTTVEQLQQYLNRW